MGHFVEIKRRGLPADMPVFLPGFGAYVRWSALGVSAQTRAFVSLAGPMAGCIGAAVCALLWLETGDAFWIGLASLSALLNVLNLIPIWVLDGGAGHCRAQQDRTHRSVGCGGAVRSALWSAGVSAGGGWRGLSCFQQGHSGGAKPHCNGLLLAGAGGAGLHHQAGADAASRPLRGAGD